MTHVNWGRQLILAASLFALGTGVYWLEYNYTPKKEAAQEEAKKIFSLKETPVELITLDNGKQKIVFKCLDLDQKLCKQGDSSHWQMIQPISDQADNNHVNELITSLNNLNPVETIQLKDETPQKKEALLREYGLDSISQSKASKLTINIGGKSTTLYLGVAHPMGDTIFAAQELGSSKISSQVYLLPKSFESHFSHALSHWRNKKILSMKAHEIDFISLNGSEGKMDLSKKEGKWVLSSKGEAYSVDQGQIDQFLNSLTLLQAKNFVDENKKNTQKLMGFNKVMTISFQSEKGSATPTSSLETLTLYSKKSPETLYAIYSNALPIFEIQASEINKLALTLKSLRQKSLLTAAERFSIQKVKISGENYGPEGLTLDQENSKWKTTSSEVILDTSKVISLLEQLSHIKTADFISSKNIQKKPGVNIEFFNVKGEMIRSYSFWEKDQKIYVQDHLENKKEFRILDKSFSSKLPWNPKFLIQATPSIQKTPTP